jgi:hypothetical protein
MSTGKISETDPRIQSALDELRGIIAQQYPTAIFEVSRGEDPEGIYLDAIVDVEDTDEVFDLVVDRLLEMQIDEELPIYVIPIRPVERVLAEMGRYHTGPLMSEADSGEAADVGEAVPPRQA